MLVIVIERIEEESDENGEDGGWSMMIMIMIESDGDVIDINGSDDGGYPFKHQYTVHLKNSSLYNTTSLFYITPTTLPNKNQVRKEIKRKT